jgi:hypothetical protein
MNTRQAFLKATGATLAGAGAVAQTHAAKEPVLGLIFLP